MKPSRLRIARLLRVEPLTRMRAAPLRTTGSITRRFTRIPDLITHIALLAPNQPELRPLGRAHRLADRAGGRAVEALDVPGHEPRGSLAVGRADGREHVAVLAAKAS